MSRQRQQRGARNKLGRQRRTNAARAKEVAGAGGEGTDCCWAQRNILRTFAGDLGTSIQETEVSNSQQKKIFGWEESCYWLRDFFGVDEDG